MYLSRHMKLRPTYFNQAQLDTVTSYKYLGVQITSNLSWKTHVQYITSNAIRML